MENKSVFYVFDTVTEEDLRDSFNQLFSDVGNNAVERIEIDENKKIVHISDPVYAASIASPDDLFNFFQEDEALTIGLYHDGCWVIGNPEDFAESRSFQVYKV
jgi:hypothetical protein